MQSLPTTEEELFDVRSAAGLNDLADDFVLKEGRRDTNTGIRPLV